jgi:hypothetical protein
MILRGIIIAKSRECSEEIQEALLKAIDVSELFCKEEESKQLREARRGPKRRSEPALKRRVFLAAILMVSPLLGFRPY